MFMVDGSKRRTTRYYVLNLFSLIRSKFCRICSFLIPSLAIYTPIPFKHSDVAHYIRDCRSKLLFAMHWSQLIIMGTLGHLIAIVVGYVGGDIGNLFL